MRRFNIINKEIICLLFISIIICTCNIISTFAEDIIMYNDGGDDGVHMTGALEPTEEDMQWMEENMIISEGVLFNDIAASRINYELESDGLPPCATSDAEVGEETVSNHDTESVSLQSVDNLIPLLSKVDNSTDNRTSKYFPPQASQGSLNSCSAFATTYYQMTYMNALANNYDVKSDPSKILSPKFTYNIKNAGSNVGTNTYSMYDVVEKHGCPSIVDFPYGTSSANPLNYRAWPTTYEVWENALYNRVQDYGYGSVGNSSMQTPVESPDDPELNLIKTYLANGYVLVINTYKYGWNEVYDPEYGKMCISVNDLTGGHAMTVVGYDDSIYYDINQNGIQEPGEFGAFKIINSWGTSNQEYWFMYDALNKVSSTEPKTGGEGIEAYENRQTGWWAYNRFYWVTMAKNYIPKLTVELNITTNSRNKIGIYLGNGDINSVTPSKTWQPVYLNQSGGNYSFDGTTEINPATIVLDYSNLIDNNNLNYNDSSQRWFVSTKNDAVIIDGFKLKDLPFNNVYTCTDVLNGDTKHIWIDAQIPLKVDKNKVWKLEFNYPLNFNTVNMNTIYIEELDNDKHPILIDNTDAKSVIVTGKQPYLSGTYYTLTVDGVKSLGGNGFNSPYAKNFIVE